MRRLTRDESRQQTIDALIGAAFEVFAEKGFEASTVDEIAERAGYTTGAIYANFVNKAELLAAVQSRIRATPVSDFVAGALPDDLEGFVRHVVEWSHQRRDEDRSQFLLNGEILLLHSIRDRVAAREVAHHQVDAYDAIAAVFEQVVQVSRLEPRLPPAAAAVAFSALLDGLGVLSWFEPDLARSDVSALVVAAMLGIPEPVLDQVLGRRDAVVWPEPDVAGSLDGSRPGWRAIEHFGSGRRRHRRTEEVLIPDLLRAGERAFSRVGYAAMTIDEVAAETGCTRKMVYECFGGKDGLFLAVLERSPLTATAVLAQATQQATTPGGLVDGLVSITPARRRSTFTYFLKNAEFWLRAARDPELSAWVAGLFVDELTAIRDQIEGAIDETPVSPLLDPARTSIGLVALTLGLDSHSFLNRAHIPSGLLADVGAVLLGVGAENRVTG